MARPNNAETGRSTLRLLRRGPPPFILLVSYLSCYWPLGCASMIWTARACGLMKLYLGSKQASHS